MDTSFIGSLVRYLIPSQITEGIDMYDTICRKICEVLNKEEVRIHAGVSEDVFIVMRDGSSPRTLQDVIGEIAAHEGQHTVQDYLLYSKDAMSKYAHLEKIARQVRVTKRGMTDNCKDCHDLCVMTYLTKFDFEFKRLMQNASTSSQQLKKRRFESLTEAHRAAIREYIDRMDSLIRVHTLENQAKNVDASIQGAARIIEDLEANTEIDMFEKFAALAAQMTFIEILKERAEKVARSKEDVIKRIG